MPAPSHRRPGRPSAAESSTRLETIITSAREEFVASGYGGTTLSAVAARAKITVPALYRYVDGKQALYELVLRQTLASVWGELALQLAAADPAPTFVGQLDCYVEAMRSIRDPVRNTFLAVSSVDVTRHAELRHLRKERDSHRDPVIESLLAGALADRSLLDARGPTREATILHIVLMGWAYATYFDPDRGPELADALHDLAELLDRLVQEPRPEPSRSISNPMSRKGRRHEGST